MGWLGDGAVSLVDAVGNAFDKTTTSDDERMQNQAVLERIRMQPDILQAEINKAEAGHRSVFVAGWRPAVGWLCVFGLAWHYILSGMIQVALTISGSDIVLPELPGSENIESLAFALLGMGGLRSLEKLKGKAK
tara:strand:- start:34205 stop:34606 length:402 start_codon:yes stop_codon:yes gene_type:complete